MASTIPQHSTSAQAATTREVWTILVKGEFYLPPIDNDGTAVFLAWPTREDAEQGLHYQINMGYLDEEAEGKVVRIACIV